MIVHLLFQLVGNSSTVMCLHVPLCVVPITWGTSRRRRGGGVASIYISVYWDVIKPPVVEKNWTPVSKRLEVCL